MKHVQACLSSTEDRESNFLGCEIAVKLVQAVYVWERPDNAVSTSEEVL